MKSFVYLAAAAAASAMAVPAQADVTMMLDRVESIGLYGAPGNVTFTFNVVPGSVLRAVNWDVTLESMPGATYWGGAVSFTNSEGFGGGAWPSTPLFGQGTFRTIGREVLLVETEILSDGILNVTFYTETDDVVGPDNTWTGRLTMEGLSLAASAVPEPSTWLLMSAAIGMTGGMLRRDRRRSREAAPAIG